jgi:hypothetical protein
MSSESKVLSAPGFDGKGEHLLQQLSLLTTQITIDQARLEQTKRTFAQAQVPSIYRCVHSKHLTLPMQANIRAGNHFCPNLEIKDSTWSAVSEDMISERSRRAQLETELSTLRDKVLQ